MSDLKRSVKRLIDRFGTEIEVDIRTDTGVNLDTGEAEFTIKTVKTKGVPLRYTPDELIEGVIKLWDVKLITQLPYGITKETVLRIDGEQYQVMGSRMQMIGDEIVKHILQLRSAKQ